jgi:hypothetical protein
LRSSDKIPNALPASPLPINLLPTPASSPAVGIQLAGEISVDLRGVTSHTLDLSWPEKP